MTKLIEFFHVITFVLDLFLFCLNDLFFCYSNFSEIDVSCFSFYFHIIYSSTRYTVKHVIRLYMFRYNHVCGNLMRYGTVG